MGTQSTQNVVCETKTSVHSTKGVSAVHNNISDAKIK